MTQTRTFFCGWRGIISAYNFIRLVTSSVPFSPFECIKSIFLLYRQVWALRNAVELSIARSVCDCFFSSAAPQRVKFVSVTFVNKFERRELKRNISYYRETNQHRTHVVRFKDFIVNFTPARFSIDFAVGAVPL